MIHSRSNPTNSKTRPRRFLTVSIGVFSLALLASSLHVSGAEPESDKPRPTLQSDTIDLGASQVGESVTVGERLSDGRCALEEFRVSQQSADDRQWTALSVDGTCSVVVSGSWTGAMSDGPSDIVSTVERFAINSEEATFTDRLPGDSALNPGSDQAAVLAYCSHHENEIWHYGLGGVIDRLTRIRGWMDPCEDGTGFTDVTYGGTCYATDLGAWEWVIEQCLKTGKTVTNDYAETTERGDFHCSPRGQAPCSSSSPDGYDHSLHTRQYKNVDRSGLPGAAFCEAWATGNLGLGTGEQIIFGCN